MQTETVTGDKLNLGDRVRLADGAFMDAVVTEIDTEKQLVKLFRPFAITANFACGNMTIPYIGVENVSCFMSARFEIVERGPKLR